MTRADATIAPDAGTYCPGCGYDLRGSAGERCPECGLARDAVPLQLPWERRRDLGRVAAFVRTARLATFRPDRLARQVMTRVDVPAARRFRLCVLAIVTAATTTAFAVVVHRLGGLSCLDATPDPRVGFSAVSSVNGPVLFWSAGAVMWPVLPIGLAIALWVGTAWDPWFDLRRLTPAPRGRAMAGARYTVAPLLGLVAVTALAADIVGVNDGDTASGPRNVGRNLWLVMWIVSAAVVLLAWTAPARYALAVPGGGAGRAAVVLAGTAVQWTLAVAVGLAAWPALVGFGWVVVDSSR